MKRRKFLSSIGVASIASFSGCVKYVDLSGDKVDKTRNMKIKNIKTDRVKTDMIDIYLNQLRSSSDEKNPLEISINIKNNRERDLNIGGTGGKIFGSQKSENGGLILLRDSEWSENILSEDCWSINKIYPLVDSEYNALVSSGESRSVQYSIFGSESQECIRPDTYRFETYYELKDSAKIDGTFEVKFGWGFNIEIE